jgi:hypothetical protein
VSRDEDTQDLPAIPPSSAPADPLHALVDALNEVQVACCQLLDAVRDQALGNIIITAHNAHSWWLIAKATLPRAAVRARGTLTRPVTDRIEHAKRMLDTTFHTLNNRLDCLTIQRGVDGGRQHERGGPMQHTPDDRRQHFRGGVCTQCLRHEVCLDKFALAFKRGDPALLEVAAQDVAQAWPLAMSGLDAVAAYLTSARRIIGTLLPRAFAEANRGSSLYAALLDLGSRLEIAQERLELPHDLSAEHESDETEVYERMNTPTGEASWAASNEISKRKTGA